jgi:hypothetical protein
MDYAILATLWNGPATIPELVGALYERTGRPVSSTLVGSYLDLLLRFGFIESRGDEADPLYELAERGSVYLGYAVSA